MGTTSTVKRKMRAIVCDGVGGPEVMKVGEDVDIPQVNDKNGDEVLLRVEMTAVNRADTLQVR